MRAYRSPARLFVFGVLGLILIVAAIDVLFGHWISTEPENTDGVLTTRGQAQQRGDILWGSVLVGTGTLLVVGAVVELVRRQPQCRITNEGIELPMGSQEAEVVIPWGDIRSVRADKTRDPFDGSSRPQLIIDVADRRGLPGEPHGTDWVGSELHVDATAWTSDVGELALSAQGALGHYRRLEEIKAMEPPSLTWRTTVGAAASDPPTAEVVVAEAPEQDEGLGDAEDAAVDDRPEPEEPPDEELES